MTTKFNQVIIQEIPSGVENGDTLTWFYDSDDMDDGVSDPVLSYADNEYLQVDVVMTSAKIKWHFGKQYIQETKNGYLYNMETHECVGRWNDETKEVEDPDLEQDQYEEQEDQYEEQEDQYEDVYNDDE